MDTLPVDAGSLPCEWPSDSKPSRWRRLFTAAALARAGLVAGSLLAAVGVLEIGLRATGAKPKTVTVLSSYFQPSATIGWIGAAGAASQFVSTDFNVFVSHDADGLRCCGLATRIGDDDKQTSEVVWCLGDSGTWGWGVDDGQTYVDRLNQLSGGAAVYRNLGVCGASSVQQRLLLEERLKSGSPPDRVVVLFCSNDLWENVDRVEQNPPRPYFEVLGANLPLPVAKSRGEGQSNGQQVVLRNYPVPAAGGWTLRTWFKKNSLAYNHLHYYLSITRKRLKESRLKTEPDPQAAERAAIAQMKADLAEHPEQIVALGEAYRQMKTLCDERGVWFAVATERAWQKEVLAPVCAAVSVPLLDLTGPWEEHLAQGGARTDFRHDPHYNATGHRLLAEAMHEQLGTQRTVERERGLLRR